MSMIELTVQAATDAALTTLLMQHGALVAGEGGVRPAPGIAYSHIGGGELDGVVLSGRYAFLAVDEEAFGQEATGTLLLALQPHRYTGPALRMLLGGSGYAVDPAAQIRMERDRRILGGVKLGNDWFHTGTQEQIQYMGMLMMGANLPPGTPLKTMAGVNVGATPQRIAALFQAIAARQAQLHAVGDAAIAAGTAPEAVQWPPIYGEPGA